MRKRDRISIAKKLKTIELNVVNGVVTQLDSSAWYFDNNATLKGAQFAYAALTHIEKAAKDLKLLIGKIGDK